MPSPLRDVSEIDEILTLRPDDVPDLFAGPGGWDVGARLTGYSGSLIGIEIDAHTCATAVAAGHDRVRADVSRVEPVLLGDEIAGLLGSPVCGPFSRSGKQLGRKDLPRIMAHVHTVEAAAEWIDYPRDGWHDPRSPLVLEVLRWVLLCNPRWFAFEQVVDVLPFWQELARIFRLLGYSTAAYKVTAEEYGVPQTRLRAFLIGSRDIEVAPPVPTHQRYKPGEPAAHGAGDLFGDGVLPWVSMAEALGWQPGARAWWTHKRPATTVQGDPRIWPPGHKVNADDRRRHADADERYGDRAGTKAIRVSVAEAAVLQSFPADYPWHGTKTAQYQQVGDAVPPMLGAAILAPLLAAAGQLEHGEAVA